MPPTVLSLRRRPSKWPALSVLLLDPDRSAGLWRRTERRTQQESAEPTALPAMATSAPTRALPDRQPPQIPATNNTAITACDMLDDLRAELAVGTTASRVYLVPRGKPTRTPKTRLVCHNQRPFVPCIANKLLIARTQATSTSTQAGVTLPGPAQSNPASAIPPPPATASERSHRGLNAYVLLSKRDEAV